MQQTLRQESCVGQLNDIGRIRVDIRIDHYLQDLDVVANFSLICCEKSSHSSHFECALGSDDARLAIPFVRPHFLSQTFFLSFIDIAVDPN